MYKIPANEQETVIQIDRAGTVANIWTSDRVMMRKLDKFADNPDSPYKLVEIEYFEEDGEREAVTKSYLAPKNLISFRSKKMVVELTDEQKQQRLKNLRKSPTGIEEMKDDEV